jgi:RecA-family ATPase
LFYPFIPFGKVTIVQGDPGEGKTTMVLQIIVKLTKGEAVRPDNGENGAEINEQALTMMDARLEEAIVQTKVRLVVLDPIQGFLGTDVDMHRANEIRPLMKRMSVLAEKYHCSIVLIGHMNKNSTGKSSYRGLGSIDFQAAARSVLIVGRVKDEPEIRVVCSMSCEKLSCSRRKIYCFLSG